MRGIDPTNPESMQQLLDSGMFELPDSPAQKAALTRLEVVLALVEGWVDEVVGQATAERMPSAGKLQEAFRRRRAAGGPAEQTFATLVGLELRPRRLRDASTLWGSLRTRQGIEARDGVWMHPHLLPTDADLDDPLGFREDADRAGAMSEEDFDAGLRALLDGETSPSPTEASSASSACRRPRAGRRVDPGRRRPAEQVALGALGVRVAVDPGPERRVVAGLEQVRQLVDDARSRRPTAASPAAARTAGWCGRPGCRNPSAASGWRPSAPSSASPARRGSGR